MTPQSIYATAKSSVGWHIYPVDTVIARGNDRLDLLQRMTTNDVSKLTSTETSGGGVSNVLLTDKARIIDVFTVLARQDHVMMLFSHGLGKKACAWLDKYTFIDDFTTENVSLNYASILVFGPRSAQLLEELTNTSLHDLHGTGSANAWKAASMLGFDVIIVKQPPLSEQCFLLLIPYEARETFTSYLRTLENIAEVSAEMFETLRIEAAWGQHGTEWTDERNPLEAGLVSLVDFKKGCYIGQEVIARLDTYNKVKVRLSGIVSDAPIPANTRFYDAAEENSADGKRTDIGGVTSTTFSPELEKYIALCYIRSAFANPGGFVQANAEASNEQSLGVYRQLEIVKLPFVI
jgi:tRNA-modifying protein YgfZ